MLALSRAPILCSALYDRARDARAGAGRRGRAPATTRAARRSRAGAADGSCA